MYDWARVNKSEPGISSTEVGGNYKNLWTVMRDRKQNLWAVTFGLVARCEYICVFILYACYQRCKVFIAMLVTFLPSLIPCSAARLIFFLKFRMTSFYWSSNGWGINTLLWSRLLGYHCVIVPRRAFALHWLFTLQHFCLSPDITLK